MPALPNIPKGFVTNFPDAVMPSFIGQRQFIFLLVWVAVFLLAILFILDFGTLKPARLVTRSPELNLEAIDFPSTIWENRIVENIKLAGTEKDDTRRFELYQQVFTVLLSTYTIDHDPKVRVEAEKLAQFIQQEFPGLFKAGNFNISCLDPECGKLSHPREIEDLIGKLEAIKTIEGPVFDSILRKIEEAGFNSDPNAQFSSYFGAFSALASYARGNNDSQLDNILQDFREFLKKSYPENYSKTEENFPGAFEI